MPIFRVKSVKIYTGQKNLHWRRQWRQWQLSGMFRSGSLWAKAPIWKKQKARNLPRSWRKRQALDLWFVRINFIIALLKSFSIHTEEKRLCRWRFMRFGNCHHLRWFAFYASCMYRTEKKETRHGRPKGRNKMKKILWKSWRTWSGFCLLKGRF